MPLIPLSWLGEYTDLGDHDGAAVAAALVRVGLEEEAVHSSGVTGPLVVGQVIEQVAEPQRNGKTINWCQVEVGPAHNVPVADNPAGRPRGIVCGAHNFKPGDKVVVALAGAVLPGPFPIAARKTYGHISDGMICSERELGLGDDHDGIIVLSRLGLDAAPGTDAISLLGLNEETIEINVTPDRGYCFSIRGVAREFAHATGASFRDPAELPVPPAQAGGFGISVDDVAPIHGQISCDRFVARIVRGCQAYGPSPRWLQRRLTQAGMRPIALGVDVTNYVMLEFGQPLHAYDLAGLAAPIVVRRALAGEHLVTLDDVDRPLDPEDLLITDSPAGQLGARVLGLAGVMGGASSEVTAATTDLLIEAAHFDPITVARTARRHKLSSEAARRFERGVDPALPPRAAQRVIDLLLEYGGGVADPAITDFDQHDPSPVISFDPALPSRIVGVDYSPSQVKQILEEIGCTADVDTTAGGSVTFTTVDGSAVSDTAQPPWQVQPPSWRPDLTRDIDLVEEVARIAGYDQIGSQLARGNSGSGLTRQQRLRRSAARTLADLGLVEVLSYPFVSPSLFDSLGFEADDPRRQAVELANPLDSTAPLLRTEILQTLLEVARRNVSRGFGDFGLFEIGQVTEPGERAAAGLPGVATRPSDAELAALTAAVPTQPRHAAAVLVGARILPGVHGPGRPADWADVIEAVRSLGRMAHVEVTSRAAARAPWHPGRCAELVITATNQVIGYAGELHPAVVTALDLPARTVAFEIDLDALLGASPERLEHAPFSTHPVAKEDLAFVVDQATPAAAVVAAVRAGAGDLVESAAVFDVYSGDQLGPGRKSVAVALRLRANDHTLSAAEITAARASAITNTEQSLGAVLRT